MKILVSGVAGDIGLGVGRILREWGIFTSLFGIDISEDHPAKIIFDQVNVAPRADSSNYLDWLCNFIKENDIDLFIPTSEAEIFVISNNIDQIHGVTKILINDQLIVNKCLDKFELLNFLNSKKVKVPKNGIVGQNFPSKYPTIVKQRRGQGGKGLQKIETESIFKTCKNGLVWQDYLHPADQEYTCAVYVSKNLDIKILLIKRVLVNGYTGKGIVVKDNQIRDYVEKIVKIFNKPGCYNVQLFLTKNGPYVFEINPRLSSTLVFRDKLGFKDLRWWISEILNIKYSFDENILEGTKIYRGNTEYILSPNKEEESNKKDEKLLDKEVKISLEKIIPNIDQLNSLYQQLEERKHKISHKILPSFEEHENFVKNNPYRAWFLVKENSKDIGNVYIQFDNSIGINCVESIAPNKIKKILNLICLQLPPLKSEPSLRRGNYFINVPSSNISLQKKLLWIECEKVQSAFILPDYLAKKIDNF